MASTSVSSKPSSRPTSSSRSTASKKSVSTTSRPKPTPTRSTEVSSAPKDRVTLSSETPAAPGSTPNVAALRSSLAVPAGAPATLRQPLATVHGLNSGAEAFGELHQRLSSNPNNQFGGVCRDGKIENANPQGNHFAVEFSSGTNRLEQNGKELSACTKAIGELTGSPQVDVMAHSQGGLAGRAAVNQPDSNIGRLAMIGTPNAGTGFANGLGQAFPTAASYLPSWAPRANGNAQAAVDDLKPGSPAIQGLNAGLGQQRQNAEMMTIAGVGAPTALSGGAQSDGVVPRESVVLPGVPNRDAQNCDHLTIHKDAGVQDAALNFLQGQPQTAGPLTCNGALNTINQLPATVATNVSAGFDALRAKLGL